jgi:hypothetical protein
MGTLPPYRQITTVTQTAVAAQIHQTLDVHLNLTPQIALHHAIGIDMFAYRQNLSVAQFIDPARFIDIDRGTNFFCDR